MVEGTTRQAGDSAFGLDNRDALLRNVIENAEIPTFITTADGVVVYANRSFHISSAMAPTSASVLRP